LAPPGVALAVLGVSSLLVSEQRYVRGEGRVSEALNDWPRAIGEPLELTMPLGTLGAGLLLTALVAVVTLRPRATLAVLLASFVAWRLDNVLKDLIERPRPRAVLGGDIVLRDTGATGFGFPSGHTTTAFALAAVLHPLLPGRWRWVAWLLAAAVGIARIYVGAHFPMDVIGGAALGVAIGGVAGLLVAGGYRRRAR
jgi:membrane-associated phospholipid phosphatase